MRPRRCRGIEKGNASERVGMVADIATVDPFQHADAGIVVYRDHPERHARKDLADDVGMPESVHGYLGRI